MNEQEEFNKKLNELRDRVSPLEARVAGMEARMTALEAESLQQFKEMAYRLRRIETMLVSGMGAGLLMLGTILVNLLTR